MSEQAVSEPAEGAGAVFIDLDRTLITTASGPAYQEALEAEGVLATGRSLPGSGAVYAFYNRFGETVLSIGLARATAAVMRGRSAEGTRRAGKRAVARLLDLVAPWAADELAAHRAAGRRLVLATTSPHDLVAPLAEALGLDDVIATRYVEVDGRYTGRLDGGFVWGLGKRAAVQRWAAGHDVSLAASHAYSDSVYDLPLLRAVGHPHALNPDPRLAAVAVAHRWPLEYWDRAPGVPSLAGLEPYHVVRPFFRPEAFPYARFRVEGLEHVPTEGPVLLASNHRSYFDVAALGVLAARLGRPVRFLAKQEIFDAPVIGPVARALGGIPVDRAGAHGGDRAEPMRRAVAALRAGEVVIILPQGTIPRGRAFYDPLLTGKTGAARLAAETGAPVVPVGVWGTEAVWPRSSRGPRVTNVTSPPTVTVRVGEPLQLTGPDAVADTARLMAVIADLLPPESRIQHIPTDEELARTRPRG